MTIGVVIVTHNNEHTIAACLTSILREGIKQVCVVDSASSDNTPAIVQHEKQCFFIPLPYNKGFAYAANIGASRLNTDYILFLNPDTELLPGAVNTLGSAGEQFPNTGVIGGNLVDDKGNIEKDAFGGEIHLLSIIFRHMYVKKIPHTTSSVAWVSGGAFMITRTIFEQLRGFDEDFFLYWEDIDLCKRVRSMGYGVYFEPNARIFHIRGVSSQDQRHKTELYDMSATRYFQKYYHPFICTCYLVLRRIYRLLRPLAR